VAIVRFANHNDEAFVLVGTVKDLVLSPRSCSGGYILCFRFTNNYEGLELLHRTPVDDVPAAIAAFQVHSGALAINSRNNIFLPQGRVLIGVGRYLRIYELGKKKMLRKCENKVSSFSHL
jgi:splicing factor 3B subunit 3